MVEAKFAEYGWTPSRLSRLDGKTYVITGANSGTGLEAARIFLKAGAKVIMLNRSAERSMTAITALKQEYGDDASVSYYQMDLADLSSVRSAAEQLLADTPHINALICNAAIAQVPTQKFTADGFESQLGTNHFGHFVLSGLLFNRINESQGRIVVVASLGYKLGLRTIQFDDLNWDKGYNANSVYSQSKLAQMMFAYELQDRVIANDGNVAVYVCHPGAAATSLIDTSGGWFVKVVYKMLSQTPLVQTAQKGAYPEVMCATAEDLEQRAFYGPTARMETGGPVGRGKLEPYAVDKPVMEKLWQVSEEMTGFQWEM